MNERVDIPEQRKAESEKDAGNASLGASGLVRRDLFRKGAVVVGATLSSRPVLAWHCKTTSAWGSELLNPATSLKNNTNAHKLFADEAWYVRDWAANTNSNGAMAGIGNPWDYLATKYPAVVNSYTKDANGKFVYTKVTVAMLVKYLGVQAPSGVSTAAFAKDVFALGNQNFGAVTLAAQLNFVLLSPKADPFNQEKCVSLTQLKAMALGNFSPTVGGTPWTKLQVVDYLFKNYIVQ